MDKKRLISDVKWCVEQGYTKEETIGFVVSLIPEASQTDIATLYDQLKGYLEREKIQNTPDHKKPQPAQNIPSQSKAKVQPSQPQSRATLIGAIFVITVAAVILTMCNTMCKPIADKPMTDNDYLNDRVYCYLVVKNYTEKLLLSPASAKFSPNPLIRSKKESEGIFVYFIDSYVDSQNTFGAMLRKKFSASVKYYVKQDEWDVYEFEFY